MTVTRAGSRDRESEILGKLDPSDDDGFTRTLGEGLDSCRTITDRPATVKHQAARVTAEPLSDPRSSLATSPEACTWASVRTRAISRCSPAVLHLHRRVRQRDNNLLDDGAVTGAPTATGVYVICRNCQGNTVLRDNVYGNSLGVIFVRFNTASFPNTVDSTDIHDNACDGVTFAGGRGTPDDGGYGIVQYSRLHDNGGRCASGIPAGGIYAQSNDVGGQITDNDIYNNCGSDIDMVDSKVSRSSTTAPGTPGTDPWARPSTVKAWRRCCSASATRHCVGTISATRATRTMPPACGPTRTTSSPTTDRSTTTWPAAPTESSRSCSPPGYPRDPR
jgi:hypothetical protein